jgi:ATP phosphoribosyltransferase regulatory subunit
MTPQAARIDAHSYVKSGPSRLCYADHVLHAKPKSPLAVRTPLQAGVELFGESSLDADIEVISLLLASLAQINVPKVTLALGHVGIYRALLESLELGAADESMFFDLLEAKDVAEIKRWASENFESAQTINWLTTLPTLCGGLDTLVDACEQLHDAPAEVEAAIDELRAVSDVITERYPEINLYFDLSELRGYHYHTGLVFAAFAEGFGDAIANGGRYDHIGEAFGRARPATGFGLNVTSVLSLLSLTQPSNGIYAPSSTDAKQWQAIQALREGGARVVSGLSQTPDFTELRCDRELVLIDKKYIVQAL